MRLSTEKDDPRYISDGSFYRFFLNGSLISRVMTADTDQGFLKVLLIGKDGKIMIDIATKKTNVQVFVWDGRNKKNSGLNGTQRLPKRGI